MAQPQHGGNNPPPKPWERAGASSGPAPFRPPSAGSTSNVVEASGTANHGEIVPPANANPAVNRTPLARPVPPRPWQPNYGNNNGYGVGGLFGNNIYRGGYGGLFGGGRYNGGVGGPVGGPYGDQDPNNPTPSPPGFWISFLRVMQGIVNVFGRIALLIDQNTQAFHMFMTGLLQFFDRSGMLYVELATFVLRLLGTRAQKVNTPGPDGLPPPQNGQGGQIEGPKAAPPQNGQGGQVEGPKAAPPQNGQGGQVEGPKAAPAGSWDNVWGNDADQKKK